MAFVFSRLEKISLVLFILMIALAGRVIVLQYFQGTELAEQALMARAQTLTSAPARGVIFDRHMQPLTDRKISASLVFFPAQCREREKMADYMEMCGAGEGWRRKVMETDQPLQLLRGIDAETAKEIAAQAPAGIAAAQEKERYSFLASHLIGYTGPGGLRGVSGLEKKYEAVLSGGNQYWAALPDAQSRLIPGLGYRKLHLSEEKAMHALRLTIDREVQQKAETIFDRHAKKGAVVVMRPDNGEILAMVSRPNFNARHLEDYLQDTQAALVNRAITAYQPGSVFKLAVAAAALEKKVVTPDSRFFDPGYINVDGTIFRGWDQKRGAHALSFSEALADSSNPVFIEVGLRLGMKPMLDFFRQLGFGKVSAAQLPNESPGNLPDAARSFRGETANLSIGQGQCETTPLQIAALVSTIVNDGVKVEPSIVRGVIDADGKEKSQRELPRAARVFSAETARALRQMMQAVTKTGTGQAAYVSPGGSAGKTGSAETGRRDMSGGNISHAWFAGFAPLHHPAYVAVIFVEEGMSGGAVAAPIFRELIESLEAGSFNLR